MRRRPLELAALCAALPLAAVHWSARLPPALDLVTPRPAGAFLAEAATRAFRTPEGRAALVVAAWLGLLAALGFWIAAAWPAARRAKPARLLLCAGGIFAIGWTGRLALLGAFDVLRRAVPAESMSPFEPLAAFSILFLGLLAAARVCAVFGAWALSARLDAVAPDWRRSAALLAAAAVGLRLAGLRAPNRSSDMSFGVVLASGARDVEGLHRALAAGVAAGDPLSRLIALEVLRCARPGAEARALAGLLSDPARHRVGPRAAGGLAAVYARWGDAAASRSWAARATAGPDGVPEGLLDLPPVSPPNGVVEAYAPKGSVETVELYCRPDAFTPDDPDTNRLVASASPGKDGRVRFEGLPMGTYFLESGPRRPGKLRDPGRRGELVLTPRRPRAAARLDAR